MIRDYIDFNVDFNSFYQNFSNSNFSGITTKKLIELKCFSKEFNNYWKSNLDEDIRFKYITIMNKIKTAPFKYRATNDAEKYLLFMFSIDPTFELFKIWNTHNTIEEIKNKAIGKFGLFDKNLFVLERFFIKNFLSAEKQAEIFEQINNDIYNSGTKRK